MKCLLIAAAVLASFGANAEIKHSEITYICGNHVLTEYGQKTPNAKNWQITLDVTTDGMAVYSGDENAVEGERVAADSFYYYLNGFIWDATSDPFNTAYSNDRGATFHKCRVKGS